MPAWALAEQTRELNVSLADGRRFLLAAKGAPFSPKEKVLIEATFAELNAEASRPAALPGEGLATRIRLLQQEAERVRTGRDSGLEALEQLASGVLVLSPLGECEFVNSAFVALAGFDTATIEGDELLSQLHRRLAPPVGQNWPEIWRAVVRERETVAFEARLEEDKTVYVLCAPLEAGAAAGNWAIILTDITDIRIAEGQREEALAFVSHDLRSPILSILALIRQQQPVGTGLEDESLKRQVERYAEKSLAVSEQFLQLSRLQSQQRLESYELDLLDPLGNACDQVYALAGEAAIEIDRSGIDKIEDPLWIDGNGELLERAFVNLLSNAIKYSDSGTRVSVVVSADQDSARVAVVDQGRGIPAEDLPRLFDPYFRSSDASLVRQRGAGLGLRFTKTVAERHGGSISVDSTPGVGSTFVIELPRLPIPADLQ